MILVALVAAMPVSWAQVVTTQPIPFRDTDAVTLVYDATKGNAALANFSGDVYIWTGVITNKSTSSSDWKYVKSPSFGQADPAAKLTRDPGNVNRYTITLTPSARAWYGVPAGEQMLRLGMIFKNAAGTVVGRGTSDADIFVDLAQNEFDLRFTQPGGSGPFTFALNTPTPVAATSAVAADLTLFLNGNPIASAANATSINTNVTLTTAGSNTLRLTATKGTTTVTVDLALLTRDAVVLAPLPTNAQRDGITYLNNGTSVILSLTAPNKEFAHVIGEFNNWQATSASYMKRTPNANGQADNSVEGRWWIQVDGLTPGREYAYQYYVDGQLKIADPYCQKILDPNSDRSIPADTYPNLKAYPSGQSGIVSVLQSNAPDYTFQVTNFQRPQKEKLVIYELLVRDFVARHDYQTLIDTLAYVQRLGANVIELMPVTEFENNDSWGYNVSFYFAPDKFYGPKAELKRFIDECHKRGIAVVLDMVLNQSFGQSPMVQLYFEDGNPAANSPWFNRTATHPFNVGYDFNHESAFTRYFSKRVMEFWLKEYNIDGYRFDLSKGFTQKVSTSVDQWSQYDQSRIDIWKDYRNLLVSVDPGAYNILEHFADNSEEKVLSSMGFMLWGNMNFNYSQGTKGITSGSDLTGGYYGARGWAEPNLVTYMESHDEERLMYLTLTEGRSAGPYSTQDPTTALARQELAATFLLPVPGPKMLWQFGELGYEVSINQNGRTGSKPIRWNYYQEPARRHLYDVYRSLIALKTQEPAFTNPASFTQDVNSGVKTMHLTDPRLNVTVVGNFGLRSATVVPNFQAAGTWYSYLTGETRTVTDPAAPITLEPGQYTVYTSRRIGVPAGTILRNQSQQASAAKLQLRVQPNPASTVAQLRYDLPQAATVEVTITNLLGATVQTLPATRAAAGSQSVTLPLQNLANGVYIVRLRTGEVQQTTRLIVNK
ncbi:T9SS C-terminal target domain-containing protein [Hymenobacter rubripertinctus]|uniref:T9SS C-terminal target domain-containing protein n=1 Tax=Hymenobacter rubripertinctus TaxID=2029981 RepID=A0A418QQ90_9BACT|nr:T9SS C-terminal target domain-containing protein [Hymenobacter rubripertinctus]